MERPSGDTVGTRPIMLSRSARYAAISRLTKAELIDLYMRGVPTRDGGLLCGGGPVSAYRAWSKQDVIASILDAQEEMPTATAIKPGIYLEVWQATRFYPGAIQLSISELDEEGTGGGYRIAGPKFGAVESKLLKRTRLAPHVAAEIRRYLDKVQEA